MPRVNFAFGMTPKKAIEVLAKKRKEVAKVNSNGFEISALSRATKIANLSNLDMMHDIYRSLEDARSTGQSFGQWKANAFEVFKKKGWVYDYDYESSGYLLADPETGEYFGTPRRLDTIYRTNTQSALSAQRYQQQVDNAESRPYWMYVAILDDRVRPSHLRLNAVVYRYDDPFWDTFYPPNGFNCRCTVIALSERDLVRRGVEVGKPLLVEVESDGDRVKGIKLADGNVIVADKGFNYNVGREFYRPNLEVYPKYLAQEYAKKEMQGESFKSDLTMIKQELNTILTNSDKTNASELISQFKRNYSWNVGMVTDDAMSELNLQLSSVVMKETPVVTALLNKSLADKAFSNIPDVIHNPGLYQATENGIEFYKEIDGVVYVAVVDVIDEELQVITYAEVKVIGSLDK